MAAASISSIGRYRWWICFLLFLATTINYIDRQILALLKPMLDVELGWTNEQFGNVNAVFQGAYAVSLLFFGWFVDRVRQPRSATPSRSSPGAWPPWGTRWSAACAASSSPASPWAWGRAETSPPPIKAVALWFPKRERAFATSLFNAGTNVGAIVAPAVVPFDGRGLGLAGGVRGARASPASCGCCSGSRSTTCPRRSSA